MFRPSAPPAQPLPPKSRDELLSRHHVISDLNMQGVDFSGTTLVDRTFFGCNFGHLQYEAGSVRGCTFELCFFQFSRFVSVTFSDTNFRNCVFACSTLKEVRFENCNVIQCNFNGVRASHLTFDDCDLLHSRFDYAQFERSQYENCNLKRARFIGSNTDAIGFRFSNQEDAVLALTEHEL